ncbi:MAG TPA: sigma-70 family RNA polymerase sigma factor [Puia sp.]|nr:sigma-70 family RNA polymerase sigma factor [Puia sp.]
MRSQDPLINKLSTRPSPKLSRNSKTVTNSRTYKSGDREDFTEIYNQLFHSVYYFIRRFIPEEEAEDITADVFYNVHKAAKTFANLQVAKSYLQIAARNSCLNHLRASKSREKKEAELYYLSGKIEMAPSHEESIEAVFVNEISKEIDQLPAQCRKVFIMHFIQGKTISQVAAEMHISRNTVKNHRTRAKAVLRSRLEHIFWSTVPFLFTIFSF